MTFSHFDVEGEHECNWDSLCVFDGDDEWRGCFCGNLDGHEVVTRSNHLEIYFLTDSSVMAPGFEITWQVDTIQDSGE